MPRAKRKQPSATTTEEPPSSHSKKRRTTVESVPIKASRKTSSPRSKAESTTRTRSPVSDDATKAIVKINRAPVLELWSSCIAHFIHPDLDWSTCLSIGSGISTITAISKGRSIGVTNPPEPSKENHEKSNDQKKATKVSVMGFDLHLEDGIVYVKGKPKTTKEANLQRKFGKDGYEQVKTTIDESLQGWIGREGELDKKAFYMYEKFRPDMPKGQQGWGRKGELDVEKIKSVVQR